jgi:2-polyprenyl-3-methyl-5-hydroxy-6-metoxy-1,4-benzoquinol methylase
MLCKMKKNNSMIELLRDLEISDADSFEPLYGKVRDREDVKVLKCKISGVIILDRTDHISEKHYKSMEDLSYWSSQSLKQARKETREDDLRRSDMFRGLIKNRIWLDFGTGSGGILELLSKSAKETYAVELQTGPREELISEGYKVYKDIKEVPGNNLEVVTLFHVLEHLPDPVKILTEIREKMAESGKIVIEVPHANDFLISFLEIEEFKEHTFWSEHLILHTRQSLKALMEKSGFRNVKIEGFQRYPLSNHLYWLSKGKPGGHKEWSHLNTTDLIEAYAKTLNSLDMTDTLICIAEK